MGNFGLLHSGCGPGAVLVWKDTKPRNAKAAGIGALVSVILSVLYYIFVFSASFAFGILA